VKDSGKDSVTTSECRHYNGERPKGASGTAPTTLEPVRSLMLPWSKADVSAPGMNKHGSIEITRPGTTVAIELASERSEFLKNYLILRCSTTK